MGLKLLEFWKGGGKESFSFTYEVIVFLFILDFNLATYFSLKKLIFWENGFINKKLKRMLGALIKLA